jgi:hypothetical protein
MAYMNQEKKAKIANNLKPILKQYGVKGTLSVRNHSSIVLKITEGKVDFIEDFIAAGGCRNPDQLRRDREIDVNPYWYHDHFSGKSKEFLKKAFAAMKSANWYDETDAQTDYFNTAYYVDVNIGSWKKPYNLV